MRPCVACAGVLVVYAWCCQHATLSTFACRAGPFSCRLTFVAGARKHKAQVIASLVLFKSRSTAAVYAQVDRRLTVTVKVEVCHWRSADLGNNKNNKNPFSLPRAGTTTP